MVLESVLESVMQITPTTTPRSSEVLEFVKQQYLHEGASDEYVPPAAQVVLRDQLVMRLRAEVLALDQDLRKELERRKELELGLRNWRLARETLETLDARARDL